MSYDCNIIYRQAKNSLRHRVLFDIRSVPHLCFFFLFEQRQPLLPRLDSEIGRCANRWGNAWAPVPDALAIA